MKKKILQILIIFLLLLLALLFFKESEKLPEYRILEVVGADRFYLDLNKNNKIDENEFVKLKYVRAFSPFKTQFSEKSAHDLNLSTYDYLKLGVLANSWAKAELLNKNVKVKGLSDCDFKNNSCYVEVKFNNKDLAKYLLLNGLAYIRTENKRASFYSYFNSFQIKNNLSKLNLLDFVIINLKNGIVHNLSCEYAHKITYAKLELKNKLTNSKQCKFCEQFEKFDYVIPKSKKKYLKSITKSFENIDLYFINPFEYKTPNPNCDTSVCKRIVKEINNSKKSIDIALYGFGSQNEIMLALKNAKNRGVEIRSVADYSKKSSGYSETENFAQ